jgi:3-hydroxyacyl-CoA dehydrogenase/enoyl-CoA hydratase/3-hydroxybutyryl-CoA epimerase
MSAAIHSQRAPVIAAMPCRAMGGGRVAALCCNYRIAVDNPRAKLGL